jgi:hypothetical protein
VLGSVAAVNPVLLVIIFLLSVSLVAVLLFGLQSPQQKNWDQHKARQISNSLPSIPVQQPAASAPETGPYGAQNEAASPGDNPYQ